MSFDSVGVVSVGETEKRRPETTEDRRSLEEYYTEAARLTLAETPIEVADVDGLGIIASMTDTPPIYPGMLAETLGFADLTWTAQADAGGSSALTLVRQAAMAIETGAAETVLCLGADTPIDPGDDGLFPSDPRGYAKNYLDPFGTQGPTARLAHVKTVHMDEYGTTAEQLSNVAITQREHAVANPLAYFDSPIDRAEYLDSEFIAEPVRLYDCVIPVNAGFGVLLTTADRATESADHPVHIAGIGECTNPSLGIPPDVTSTGIAPATRDAFAETDREPADADFLQLYDDYPIVVAMQLEDLGLCAKGEGGDLLASADLRYDGDRPLNTSGGQLSAGQPGMAGGFVQLVEGVRQLQGEGGDRQVPDPEWGIVTGVGGIGYAKNLRHNTVGVLGRGEDA